MASESLQIPAGTISCPPQGTSTRVKFRIRFRKAGDLRLVSHHDLMHIFERTFRRADLAVPVTQGFNPRPRMWFALSLALGIAGLNEVLELELAEPLSADELQRRLAAHAPPGIEILSVHSIDVRTSAHVRRAWYRIPLPLNSSPHFLEEGPGLRAARLAGRCSAFMNETTCWIERMRPHQRRINLRPFVSELRASAEEIVMALWITPNGAARPGEILTVLGLGSLVDDGVVIERTDLEIIDELPPDVGGPPAMENVTEEITADDGDAPRGTGGSPVRGGDEAQASRPCHEETQLSSRPTAIIGNPLSFDS